MIVPPKIASEEPLLRAFSLPSGLDENKKATVLVFCLRKKEKDISLSRKLYLNLMEFLKKAIKFRFSYLSKRDVTSGAVEIIAGDVESLNEHIVLEATPSKDNPAHASILYLSDDGTVYEQPSNTTEPADPSILGYELALVSIVRKIYDLNGDIIWSSDQL